MQGTLGGWNTSHGADDQLDWNRGTGCPVWGTEKMGSKEPFQKDMESQDEESNFVPLGRAWLSVWTKGEEEGRARGPGTSY